jgi:hypothetical protein
MEMRRSNPPRLHPHKVILPHFLPLIYLNQFLADVEAEDLELGHIDNDLAIDVDEDVANEDPEALDSDDERPDENEELGIDMDETESKSVLAFDSTLVVQIII